MVRNPYFDRRNVFQTPILQTSAENVRKFFGFKCGSGEFLLKLNAYVISWKNANIGQYSVDEEDIRKDKWNAVILMRTLAFQMVLRFADEKVEMDPYRLACGAQLCAEHLRATLVDDCGDLEIMSDYTKGFHQKCRTAIPTRANKSRLGLPERLSPVKRVYTVVKPKEIRMRICGDHYLLQ